MIVSYEIVGPWVNRIPHTGPDEFLIGIFVPNKDNELRDEYRGMSLEEYLRGSEQADHMSWTDYAIDSRRPGIIGKIRDQVCRKVANVYRDQPNRSETKHLGGLGRASLISYCRLKVLVPDQVSNRLGRESQTES